MTISRGQMNRQLYMGGGIMDVVPRDKFFLGKIAKAAKKTVKKVTRGVKDLVKSDVGKAALLAAAGYYAGGGNLFGLQRAGMDKFAFSQLPGAGFFTGGGSTIGTLGNLTKGPNALKLGEAVSSGLSLGKVGAVAGLAGLSGFLSSKYGMTEEEQAEELRDPEKLKGYLRMYYTNLNPNAGSEEIEEFVATNSGDYTAGLGGYAEGGRIGFADGPVLPPDPTQPVNPFGPRPGDFGIEEDIPIKMASNLENDKILEMLFEKYLDMGLSPKEAEKAARDEFDRMSKRKMEDTRGLAALGGKMDSASDNAMQAAGIEGLPVRKNQAGVKELDLRNTGGFIQPVGIKEKADDIPAMLSNNEFVMTADAVKGAGGGDVRKGAQRMYDTMKRLEKRMA